MLLFHVHIHPLAVEATPGKPLRVQGEAIPTLQVPAAVLGRPLGLSFDEALAALNELPRLYSEPDGSMLYSGEEEGGWQVEGQLTDGGPRLASVELKGRCPEPAFDRLLGSLGWPGETLMFQLAHQAVFLDEAGLRQYARLADDGDR